MPAGPRRALAAAGLVALTLAAWPRIAPGPAARIDLGEHGGGWSGVDVRADGGRAFLVHDRGGFLDADLARAEGVLTGLVPRQGPGALGLGDEVTDSEGVDAFDPGGETPGGESPGGETSGSETSGGETPGYEIPGSETAVGESPGDETPGDETPGGETQGGESPGAETIVGETPGAETFDSEIPGDAVDGDEIVVSFEGFARLRRFARDDPAGPWGWMQDLPREMRTARNRGLEAVARDRQGRAYTLAERPAAGRDAFDLLRLSPLPHWHVSDWQVAARLAADPGWWAVGADFGPDGAFHLLERRFLGVGFASRIRRFDPASFGAAPVAGTVIWSAAPFRYGNLEGLALWRDADGATRAVMVSDDNGWPVMRGEMVEIVLPGAPLAPGTAAQ